MSDILDIRNWNLTAFDPDDEENKNEKENEYFEEELESMCKKFEECKEFYEDLDIENLRGEFRSTLRLIYESEKEGGKICRASKKEHHFLLPKTHFLNDVLYIF